MIAKIPVSIVNEITTLLGLKLNVLGFFTLCIRNELILSKLVMQLLDFSATINLHFHRSYCIQLLVLAYCIFNRIDRLPIDGLDYIAYL